MRLPTAGPSTCRAATDRSLYMLWLLGPIGQICNSPHDAQNPPGSPKLPRSLAGERTTLRLGTTALVRTVRLAGLTGGPLGSHLQDLRAAERDVRVEGEGLVRRQLQTGVAPGEFGYRDLGL